MDKKRKKKSLAFVMVLSLVAQSFLGLGLGMSNQTEKVQAASTAINLEKAATGLYVGTDWAGASADLLEEDVTAVIATTDSAGGFGKENEWGLQYKINDLPVVKNAIYTLEFDVSCTIDKKVTAKLVNVNNPDGEGVIYQVEQLNANELHSFSYTAATPMPADETQIVFALGCHNGEDENRQGEVTISNVRLIINTPPEAIPIAINREGSLIIFQKNVASPDAEDSVTVLYDIFNSAEEANAVEDYTELTKTENMAKVYEETIWQATAEPETPLEDGQACRFAFVTNLGENESVSELSTYVFNSFTPQDYEIDTLEREGMDLVWQDEFDGNELDLTKWSYQIGTKAPGGPEDWGNQEAQYYTDKNHEIIDGKLVITAKKEAEGGKEYTSTRIRTVTDDGQDLFTTKYGRVEARMKLPVEEGTWPAFWMLPEDGGIYEGWAASGEIDIMEARGRIPGEIGGAIHYGSQWPNNVYHGKSYQFDEEVTDISGFHLYSVEWEPGKITWYVDDEEYYSTSNWYSRTIGNAEDFTYGAPFDTPYYIILNLAIGGTFDGGANLANADFPAKMEVDYVRVYQKEEGYDDEDLVKPDIDKDTEAYNTPAYQPTGHDGDYIKDTDFTTLKTQAIDPLSSDWQFTTGFNGAAAQSLTDIDGTKYAAINITGGGDENYAVQLIKHMPFAKGYTYQVSFNAKADAARDIIVKPCGDGDNGWAAYTTKDFTLTSEITHYEFEFTMGMDSDPTARLEFNLGLNTTNVYIGNVVVKAVESNKEKVDNTDMPKVPLTGEIMSGEQIYNGTFDQGKRRFAFWHVNNVDAYVPSVVGEKDYSRRAQLSATGTNPSIYQKGIELLQSDQYELSLDISSERNTSMDLVFRSNDGTRTYMKKSISYTSGSGIKEHRIKFAMPKDVTDRTAVFELKLENGSKVSVDNISLKRRTSHNTSVDYSDVEMVPIPLNSEGWSGVDIETGDLNINTVPDCISVDTVVKNINHQRMLLHGVELKAGVKYKLQFEYKADYASKYALTIQEDTSWSTTYEDMSLNTTTGWSKYEAEFTSKLTNGSNPIYMKFLLSGSDVTPGKFYVKDISLVAVAEEAAEEAPQNTITAAAKKQASNPYVMQVTEGRWRTAFMSAAASTEDAVIMVGATPLTNLASMINEQAGTITIPASYFSAGQSYTVLVSLKGYQTIGVNVTVDGINSGGGDSSNTTPPVIEEKPKEEPVAPLELPVEKKADGTVVTVVKEKGEYDFASTKVEGSLEVSGNGAVIKNLELDSDAELILEGKNLVISDSEIKGTVTIPAGNTSSVTLNGTTTPKLVVEKPTNNSTKRLRLNISNNSSVEELYVNAGTRIEIMKNAGIQAAASKYVVDNIYISVPEKAVVTLSGDYNKVTLSSKKTSLKLLEGKINKLTVKTTATSPELILVKGTSITALTVTPKTASETLAYKSSNKKITAVSGKGKVKAVKKGTSTITVTNSNGKAVKCKVTVK